jgi:Zn-dependent peptidase ImmA (M78 family)/transcriptional regulator with XRE-family HTH domain
MLRRKTVDAAGPRIIPERIREAREATGLTMEEFAEQLGISKQAVGQYEVGQIAPGAPVMSSIIALTGQPPSFFTAARVRSADGFGIPYWRGLKRMNRPDRLRISRRLEWAWDVVNYIERFIDLPPVNLPSVEWDFEFGSDTELERIAARVRDHWGLGRGPIHHLAAVMESHGIIIIKEPVRCDEMDAVSRWQSGRPFILCSADKDHLPRKNFDLAHELGHIVLHYGIEATAETLSRLEKQADYFAGAFLMPRETFSREVVSTSLHYFFKLKERWRVSVQAMVYRSKELGLLNKSQVNYLWRQLTAKGMRKEEPLDTAFGSEQPTILAAALRMLVEHDVQTRSQIIDALNLNPKDLESLCGTETGFLDEKVVSLRFRTEPI